MKIFLLTAAQTEFPRLDVFKNLLGPTGPPIHLPGGFGSESGLDFDGLWGCSMMCVGRNIHEPRAARGGCP